MSGGSLARTSSRNLPTSQEREVGDERVQRTRYRDDDEEVEEEETEDEEADDDDATQRGDSGAAYYGFGGAPKTNNSLKAPQFI
jgi:serine/threonine protein kinase HipA of HipAB toxin-antitoxin module